MTLRNNDVGTTASPGSEADAPTQIPARGWWEIVKRAWREGKADQVPLLAAGVAYYGFLAIFPTFVAVLLLYGLVSTPEEVTEQVESVAAGLPGGAQDLLTEQLTTLAESSNRALSVGLVVSVLLALWSASGGVGNLVQAVNTCYDEQDTRGFVKKRGLSLALTLGAVVFIIVAVGLITVVPPLVDSLGLGVLAEIGIQIVRWAGLAAAMVLALAVLYRVAPDRDAPRLSWVSPGAIVATVIWIVASVGFSLYVDNFGSYGKTYGSLAGVVILLLWLWITAYIVLLGAEVNAESEAQTLRDTTVGEPRPLGQRNAVKADEKPPSVIGEPD